MNEDGGIPPTPPEPPAAPPTPPPVEPPAQPSGPAGNPWERRAELGFANGLVDAIKSFTTAPASTFEQTLKSGDLGSPLLYAVIIATAMALIGSIWSMVFGTSILSMLPLPPEAMDSFGFLLASSGAGIVMSLIMTPIFTVIGLFIFGGILHLMLLLVGGLENSEAGFEGTLRAAAYSQTSTVAQIVPVIGGMISFIWGLFLIVTGITRLHGTSDGKAIAAVLLPIVLCCLCIVAMFTFGVGAAFMGANN